MAQINLWIWKIFVKTVDTPVEELPNMHQPDQFDLSQGPSSNWIFSIEINGMHHKFILF